MPPVEVVPYIWTRERVLICGRVTALRQADGACFGVQIPAPTALCTDHAAVRALLVHEFAHWFYIATRVMNGSESGEKEAGTLDLRNEGLAESDTQINAQDWFGEEDARRFIQHGDSATRSISSQAAGLEQQFYVVSPRMGDTVGSIDISDDVKAHIRSLRTRRTDRAQCRITSCPTLNNSLLPCGAISPNTAWKKRGLPKLWTNFLDQTAEPCS